MEDDPALRIPYFEYNKRHNVREKLEVIKGITRSHSSKDRQHNGQKKLRDKNDKNNNQNLSQKTKD